MIDRVAGGIGKVKDAVCSRRSRWRRGNVWIANGKCVNILACTWLHANRRPHIEIDRTHKFMSGHKEIADAYREPVAKVAIYFQIGLLRIWGTQIAVYRCTALHEERVVRK